VTSYRLLGCTTVGTPQGPLPEGPIDRLALTALVLATVEVQMAYAEEEVLTAGGSVDDAWIAAEVTARLSTGGDAWACRRWLTWHAGRLIYQLRRAEARGDLPPKTGTATAQSVFAAHRLLVELTAGHDGHADLGYLPLDAVAQARDDLVGALHELAQLVYGDGGHGR
jgi:hypothetical protein